jgi:Domain of unknown function (DUF4337)
MDVNPMEAVESAQESAQAKSDRAADRLNALVAISVALLATFMAVCKVKDDNLVQAMQQAQADKVDHWSFYQARNIREEVANATLVQLKLAASSAPETAQAGYTEAIAKYTALAQNEELKKQEVRAQAEQDQKTYDSLNVHDDQFDLSDAALAIAISLLAMTALTRKKWLYVIALVPTVLGVIMGLAGLFGWALHPEALTSLLN